MNLESLALLELIESRGSFAAAATALNKAPSAITYQLRQLEDSLDILIYDRSGHKAQLTPAGKVLLEEGRRLLAQSEELKQRVKATASGWEPELRIVIDGLIPFDEVLPWIQAFDQACSGTRLRISQEVLSGTWEALYSGRADLLIGTHLDQNQFAANTGLNIHKLGKAQLVFAIAPDHPLAREPEPISNETLAKHRAVAVGDTSRQFKPLTFGLQSGQHVLTVPTLAAKVDAQLAGLGTGWLPWHLIKELVAQGKLVTRKTEDTYRESPLCYAWQRNKRGNALAWWTDYLRGCTLNLTRDLQGHG